MALGLSPRFATTWLDTYAVECALRLITRFSRPHATSTWKACRSENGSSRSGVSIRTAVRRKFPYLRIRPPDGEPDPGPS